jgi:hypothetical protein
MAVSAHRDLFYKIPVSWVFFDPACGIGLIPGSSSLLLRLWSSCQQIKAYSESIGELY